ncbi:hypothetical protein BO219_04050 [Anoxybacillus kestanbolensis]|uniref:Uncharacterized protein n=2 Tax=Anoxybacillus kestanbolensis TaxID=227476 RepID=A0A1V3FTU4_9BACL|nr:hypothetical protein [Anoxybacillus kestanbolensis]OOE04580.1 hypothetical protein BO219_04050 [Anoxybacillus kestanbolensis]
MHNKKALLFAFFLIPVPFIFHFYEYGRYMERKGAPFLLFGFLLAILLGGVIAVKINILLVSLLNSINLVLSLVLATVFIPDNPSWFTVVGRNGAVVFIWSIYLAGQMFIKGILHVVRQ